MTKSENFGRFYVYDAIKDCYIADVSEETVLY